MKKLSWATTDYKKFKSGDIICDADTQDFPRIVIKVEKQGIWCSGLAHVAFNAKWNNKPPIFFMAFEDIENEQWPKPLKLGNLEEYKEYINCVQDQCNL